METALNFNWSFIPSYKKEYLDKVPSTATKVDIPHAPVTVPLTYFNENDYQKVFTYFKDFNIDSFNATEKYFLRFEGVMLKLHLYLNGHDLGEQISGWVPVTFDISDYVKPAGNHLVALVDAQEDPTIPPFGGDVDYLTFAGIYREVYLINEPKSYLESIYGEGNMNGLLHLGATIKGPTDKTSLAFRLYDGSKLLGMTNSDSLKIAKPKLWSPSSPFLYTLEATLTSPSGVSKKRISVGFRSVLWNEEGFFLNGEKLKLIGLNRHQNYPYVGPAMPKSSQEEDADIIKIKLGCNVVRTSHYPQSEHFLRRCDEIGLLLIDEIPGWQYIGKDEAWRHNFAYFLEKMISKERSHPCLIAYGTHIDESDNDDELYSKAVNFVHETDPYRPTLGVRNVKNQHCLEDIYAYNDFSCSNIHHGLDNPKTWSGAKGKAKIVTEHDGHMFVHKSFDAVDRRTESALRHLRVINDAYHYSSLAGALGWCAFDYYTHADFGSGNHICYHGVEDMFRNPKASAYAYASQREDLPIMWISNAPVVGDNDECLLKPLVVLTNCDYVELYRNDKFVGAFLPDKKDYPSLPHAPIFIDDFVGSLFKENKVKVHDQKKVISLLNLVATTGISHVKPCQLIKYLPALLNSHLSFKDLFSYYDKYINSKRAKSSIFMIRGYKNGKLVNEKKYGPSLHFFYRYEVSKQNLVNEDTYDTSRISIKFVDEYGTQLHYGARIVNFSTQGPIEIIGPKSLALEGGDGALYIRSLKTASSEKARLSIEHEGQVDYLDFTVQ